MPTSSERRMRARVAAYARAAKHDGQSLTAAARSAAWQRYLDEVDPAGALPEGERIRRAQALRKSRLLAAALKSARTRRLKKAATFAKVTAQEADRGSDHTPTS